MFIIDESSPIRPEADANSSDVRIWTYKNFIKAVELTQFRSKHDV